MNVSSSPERRFLRTIAIIVTASAATFAGWGGMARADSATALQSGPNTGSADSFQGPHDWFFEGKRGAFDLSITSLGQGMDSVPLDGTFSYKIYFYPTSARGAYTFKRSSDGFAFHGKLSGNARVVVRIVPATSTLVRVAKNYTIEVSGDAVSFDGAALVDPVVGTYMDMSHGHGAAHFTKDGTIAFADGSQGTWTLFDRELRIYTVTIGSDRMSVKFVPGRGLIDRGGGGLAIFDTIR